jgi:hypothetical protein
VLTKPLLAGELLHLPGKPTGVERKREIGPLAGKLLHLPGKPAGVERKRGIGPLAAELLHLPGKPAGVAIPQVKVRETPESRSR